jgi:hypothetical protein
VRLAAHDQRQDAIGPPQPLEQGDLLVDPAAACRRRAAQHDQMARLSQRLAQHRRQVRRRGELVAVAKDREDFWWDRTVARRPTDQRLGHAIAFDGLVQPPRPALVAMAVADEYRILAPGGNDTRRVHARLRPGRSSLAQIVTTTVVRQEEKKFSERSMAAFFIKVR